MNNFLQLVRLNIMAQMTGSFNVADSTKKKKIFNIILFSFLGIYLLAFCGYFAYTLGKAISYVNMQQILIVLSFVVGSMITFMTTFFAGFGLVFKSKDYELLASLPIKKWAITASKIISLVITNYLYSIILFLPFAVVYFIFVPLNFVSLLFTVFGFLLLPMFPVFVGLLLTLIVNLVTTKLPLKNIITIILCLALFVAIMLLSQNLNSIIAAVIYNNTQSLSILNAIYFPAMFISKAVADSSILYFFYYILISTVPLMILTLFISLFYTKLNSYYSKSAKVKAIKYSSNDSGVVQAFFTKELKRIFSSPMYILNSCIGPVILVIFLAASIFNSDFAMLAGLNIQGVMYIVILIPTLILMMSPSNVSFSMEGKSFWLLKTYPVSLKQILIGKGLAVVAIFAVPCLAACIICSCTLELLIAEQVLLYAITIACILATVTFGLAISVTKIKLDWVNETTVSKQSANVFIQIIVGMVVGLAPGVVYLTNLTPYLEPVWFELIMLAVVLIMFVCSVIYLNKKAKFLFDKINP